MENFPDTLYKRMGIQFRSAAFPMSLRCPEHEAYCSLTSGNDSHPGTNAEMTCSSKQESRKNNSVASFRQAFKTPILNSSEDNGYMAYHCCVHNENRYGASIEEASTEPLLLWAVAFQDLWHVLITFYLLRPFHGSSWPQISLRLRPKCNWRIARRTISQTFGYDEKAWRLYLKVESRSWDHEVRGDTLPLDIHSFKEFKFVLCIWSYIFIDEIHSK